VEHEIRRGGAIQLGGSRNEAQLRFESSLLSRHNMVSQSADCVRAGFSSTSGVSSIASKPRTFTRPRLVTYNCAAISRELLERSDRSALHIALDVGFKTPSHFTSRFRREFGVTPCAVRPHVRHADAHLEL
jgi:AraC-like DNA-binding protein